MSKYQNGKIYKIVDNTTGDVYIGSTTQCLSSRLSEHVSTTKKNINKCTSKHIIENGDYTIALIEAYPCNNKNELHLRERYWIENTVCINRCIPTRTPKQYHETHRDEILQRHKQYHETHRDEILQYQKQYRETHRDEISQYKKQHYTCECGSTIGIVEKARHNKSKRHIAYINSLG